MFSVWQSKIVVGAQNPQTDPQLCLRPPDVSFIYLFIYIWTNNWPYFCCCFFPQMIHLKKRKSTLGTNSNRVLLENTAVDCIVKAIVERKTFTGWNLDWIDESFLKIIKCLCGRQEKFCFRNFFLIFLRLLQTNLRNVYGRCVGYYSFRIICGPLAKRNASPSSGRLTSEDFANSVVFGVDVWGGGASSWSSGFNWCTTKRILLDGWICV